MTEAKKFLVSDRYEDDGNDWCFWGRLSEVRTGCASRASQSGVAWRYQSLGAVRAWERPCYDARNVCTGCCAICYVFPKHSFSVAPLIRIGADKNGRVLRDRGFYDGSPKLCARKGKTNVLSVRVVTPQSSEPRWIATQSPDIQRKWRQIQYFLKL